jgi:hypothetical protein
MFGYKLSDELLWFVNILDISNTLFQINHNYFPVEEYTGISIITVKLLPYRFITEKVIMVTTFIRSKYLASRSFPLPARHV